MWLCNLVASSNIFRHISQMKAFLLEWAIRWFLKLIPWRKFSWHISHVKDFSPVCVSICLLKLGWISRHKFHKWKISPKNVLLDVSLINEHDQTSSNNFHKWKILPQYVSVDVVLNYWLVWISSNKFYKWKICPQYMSVDLFLNYWLG